MITQVEIKDFLSHNDTVLDFDTGMNVILGPNGAGKSSIVDAITFGLFGKHTRGINRALVRHGASDGYVRVKFQINGRQFNASRVIKNNGSTITTLSEKKDGKWQDIAAGERKQMGESTSHEIEKILGMDFEMLQLASIIRQGELANIIHETPKDFKNRINDIIGLDTLDNAHNNMNELIHRFRDNIQKELGYNDTHLLTLDTEITNDEASLQEAITQTTVLDESKKLLKIKVEEITSQINTMKESANAQKEWDITKSELEMYVKSKLDEMIAECSKLDNAIKRCTAALEMCDKGANITTKLDEAKKSKELFESRINSNNIILASLHEKLELSSKIVLRDGKCPVCNSRVEKLNAIFDKNHLDNEISRISIKRNTDKTTLAKLIPEISNIEEVLKNTIDATATLQAYSINKEEDLMDLKTQLEQLETSCKASKACLGGDMKMANKISPQAQMYANKLASLGSKLDSSISVRLSDVQINLENTQNKLDEAMENHGAFAESVKKFEQNIAHNRNLKIQLETVKKYINKLDSIQEAFHRDGTVATSLRSWALTIISNACSEYLAALDTRINRITLSEKKRTVDITCHSGNDSFEICALSGGEQICVALALRLGMSKLSTNHNSSFVILDEPTAHLDAERRKSLARTLIELASSNESDAMQFIIITHDTDIFDELSVEKRYELKAGNNGTIITIN